MRVLAGTLALLVFAPAVVRADEPTQRDLLEAIERHLKAAHETAGPAVACVVVSRSDKYPKPDRPPEPWQLGGFDPKAFLAASPGQGELARRLDLADPKGIADHTFAGGVVIDPAGLVLTNYHTIDGATKVYVHLTGGKGSYADIHAADARSDLAVLKLLSPPAGLTPIRIGDARLHDLPAGRRTVFDGKLLVVMAHLPASGFASGRPDGSLGNLTGVKPPASTEPSSTEPLYRSVYRYAPLLEFDARSNPGCSGAAVLDLRGELIGLTTTVAAVAGGTGGHGYALPMDDNTRRIVDVLRRGEEVEYGFLGVSLLRSVVPESIVVDVVSPNSPAAAAGVRPGDTITRINDHPARTYPDLLWHVGSALAGNPVRLTLERNGRSRPVELTVSKFKGDTPFVASVRPDPVFGLRVDHGSILGQTLPGGVPPGVVVRELVPESPAAAKFKAIGDNPRWLITRLNGTPTPTPAAFYKAANGVESVTLTVIDPTDATTRPREVTLP